MKQPTKYSIWIFWLPLGVAIAAFFLIPFVGGVIFIGSKLGLLFPSIEKAFYSGLALTFIWLIAVPVIAVLAAPVLALEDLTDDTKRASEETLKKVARQLLGSAALDIDSRSLLQDAVRRGASLREPLAAAINAQKKAAAKNIRAHAVKVFVTTAVSQSGRLDVIAVLAMNFKLVRTLVKNFGCRPPLPLLIKIYSQIFLAAFVADELDDVDMAGAFGHLGLGAITAIPGTGLIANSALDGAINAMFTLRVGYVTQKCLLNAGSNLTTSQVRRAANQEARQDIIPVLRDASPLLPSAVKSVVERMI